MPELPAYLIYGAGLAGLNLGLELHKKGVIVGIVETAKSSIPPASEVPVAIANYATALQARLMWRADQCMDHLYNRITEIDPETHSVLNRGLIRPALDSSIHKSFLKAYRRNDWTDICPAEWWNTKQIQEYLQLPVSCDGGLWLPNALAIHMQEYLDRLRAALKQKGVMFLDSEKPILDQQLTEVQEIYCTGFGSKDISEWSNLPLHGIKGQLDVYSEPLGRQGSSSARGYTVWFRGEVFQGSTYEHEYEHVRPTDNNSSLLTQKLRRYYEENDFPVKRHRQWASIRMNSKDRMPVLGSHPHISNKHIFTALGSKGLLYSAYLSKLMADYLIEKEPLPPEINLTRFI